jgi:lysine 2,3-aminomutase
VGVIRLHSRVPVVSPEFIDASRLAALRVADSAVYIAVHCNHADELGADARHAIAALADAGIPLLGQTVLLRGVNDTVEALEILFRAMVRLRIKPYYLHHADLAPGTAHFRTGLAEGRALVGALRGRLSGIAQPTYVLDIPGGHGKVPVGPCYLRDLGGDNWSVTDPQGEQHPYPPVSP